MNATQLLRGRLVPVLVLAALAGTNVTGALLLPPGDGDLGWQHWLGVQILRGGLPHALGAESFAANGAPWVPQEWLFCSMLALAAAHGASWLFAAAVGMCSVVALGCVALRCERRGAGPLAIGLVLIFTDVAMSQSLGVRVQVVAWALAAALLLLLELPLRWRWTAVLVAAAWANVHASAMLAPVLAGAAACGAVLDRDRRSAVYDALLTLGCALAVCATPLGIALPAYAIALVRSPIRHWIHEWHAVALTDPAFALGALPAIALAAFAARRASWRTLALTLPFGYLAFTAVRNVPLAAIAFAPLAASALGALLPSLQPLSRLGGRLRAPAAVAAAFVVLAASAAATTLGARSAHDVRPLLAIRDLARLPGPHHLLCEDFAWCGPALDTGAISVFLDGRADPFPLAVWNDYDTVYRARPAWQAVASRRGIDAMLVHRGGRLDRAALRSGWHAVDDAPVRVLVRPALALAAR